MVTSDEASRGRPTDPRLDEALIAAAIAVLGDQGFGGFTTSAVARRAGASTASLYRRWTSKHALLADVATRIVEDEFGGLDAGSLPADLRSLLTRKQRLFDGPAGSALLSLMGQAAHDDELRAILRERVYLAARGALESTLQRAVARGEVPGSLTPPELDLLALVAIGTGLARSVFGEPDARAGAGVPDSATPAAAELVELEVAVLLGLLVRPDRPPATSRH
ncbi:MAG: TetR/AcrR family transcriptional regulator [Propionicimonas sp.]|nr:TetR/AcrR family transcriptional regulator [Propionicimonas sp.]